MRVSGFGVQIPNGCGSFLGAAQLILYAVYRNRGGNKAGAERGGKQHAADGADDDVEMASGSDVKGSNNKVAGDVDVDGAARKEDRTGWSS